MVDAHDLDAELASLATLIGPRPMGGSPVAVAALVARPARSAPLGAYR